LWSFRVFGTHEGVFYWPFDIDRTGGVFFNKTSGGGDGKWSEICWGRRICREQGIDDGQFIVIAFGGSSGWDFRGMLPFGEIRAAAGARAF
jgi:hypothetical protein